MTQIGFQIHPRPEAQDASALELLRGIPTPILSDNMARMFAVGPALRPYHRGGAMIGSALTVRTRPGDNLMVHKAIDIASPRDVIVVDAGGELAQAIIGEIMTTLAMTRGVAGFVIAGAVRDSGAIAAEDFPVYAAGVTPRGPYKDGPGEINVPVSVGGMVVHPGDIIVGDEDGVVAVPLAEAEALLKVCAATRQREDATLSEIRAGSIDRSWVDALLKSRGFVG